MLPCHVNCKIKNKLLLSSAPQPFLTCGTRIKLAERWHTATNNVNDNTNHTKNNIDVKKMVFSPETIDFYHYRGDLKKRCSGRKPPNICCRCGGWGLSICKKMKAFLFVCWKSYKHSAAPLIWSRDTSDAEHCF